MAISFRNLQGSKSPLDVVIASHLTGNWTVGNITSNVNPTIESGSNQPDFYAQVDNVGPNAILINIERREKVPIDEGQEPNGDYTHAWRTWLTIDVFAETSIILGDMEDEINRILWTIAPNNSVRLKKTYGGSENSEIQNFAESEIVFERFQPEGKRDDNPSSRGLLVCYWYKDNI